MPSRTSNRTPGDADRWPAINFRILLCTTSRWRESWTKSPSVTSLTSTDCRPVLHRRRTSPLRSASADGPPPDWAHGPVLGSQRENAETACARPGYRSSCQHHAVDRPDTASPQCRAYSCQSAEHRQVRPGLFRISGSGLAAAAVQGLHGSRSTRIPLRRILSKSSGTIVNDAIDWPSTPNSAQLPGPGGCLDCVCIRILI